MTTEKRQNPQRFAPQMGEVYENAGGGRYLCTRSWDEDTWTARFLNTASGWELTAHGIVRYEDGTIEWDYSTGGGFNDGRLQEYRENCRRAEKEKEARTAQLWHRQISLANAMLCFMI